MIKKLIAAIVTMMFIGCATVSIKPNDEVLTVLQKSAVSTVGYLIAKNKPDRLYDILAWYSLFQNASEFVDIQAEYQNGIQKLSELISDDPFLQMQIKNAMDMLKISFEGPQLPDELTKYSQVVDYFMIGVSAIK